MGENSKQFLISVASFLLLATNSLLAQEPAAPPAAKPAPGVRPAMHWKRFDYTCEGGAKLSVYLHNESVKVLFKDKTYLMKQTMSASGTRYSDGKVLWWSKGNGGFLQKDTPDGNGAMIVQNCELENPLNSEPAAGTVSGTVTYLQRIALPPSAVIQVELQDVSLVDSPAKLIADEKITLGERQAPVPFELKFDATKIDANHRYAINARILVDGRLRFINNTAYPVLPQGHPAHVELILQAAPPATN
jgi:uncharacterized lipoprotein YbaY